MADLAEELAGKVQVAGPIRDGDTLILRLPGGVTYEQFREYTDQLDQAIKAKLPEVRLVFVAGVEQILVYRPEASNG